MGGGGGRLLFCLALHEIEFLTLSKLCKIFISTYGNIFLIFQKKTTGFDISCKLSSMKTICMKCYILFSGKNKRNGIYLSSADLAKVVVKVSGTI